MIKPESISNMSEAMADVYGAVTDRILINLAHYFPYIKDSEEVSGSFEYQARMLAQIGQVNKETSQIIADGLGGADGALQGALETSILDALQDEEPKLREAARRGFLGTAEVPEVDPRQMNAFKAYYRQSADKLNLVNTVMLESTQAAYSATVSDITSRMQRTQSILNEGTGEVISGVSTYNQAVRGAVKKMVDNGITGFIDHGGHRWSPEAYAAMDIRTTMYNTSRAAIWERNEAYGNDLYQVSYHNGARPLCYPWQGKIISRDDLAREVEDFEGNTVHVYAQSETTYGQAAGLFGVNCGHYPMVFIPGISSVQDVPQNEEENAKTYEESQQQRALERKLREERRDLAVMKAQGAPEDEIRAQRERVKKASQDIEDFCDETGRTRRKDREGTPVNAKFPPKDSYDPKEFPTRELEKVQDYYRYGGSQSRTYTFSDAVHTEEPVSIVYGGIYGSETIQADIYTMPDGMRFAFKKDIDKNLQTLTPEKAVDYWYRVPQSLRDKGQKQINVVDTYNPADKHFQSIYKGFTHSYATGGDAITFFRYERKHDPKYLIEETLYHEIGHHIDDTLGSNGIRYSLMKEWGDAMSDDYRTSGKKSITYYGENSPAEDFAESVKEYTKYRKPFLTTMPKRGKILDRILQKGGVSP